MRRGLLIAGLLLAGCSGCDGGLMAADGSDAGTDIGGIDQESCEPLAITWSPGPACVFGLPSGVDCKSVRVRLNGTPLPSSFYDVICNVGTLHLLIPECPSIDRLSVESCH